jgi:hypothetical protein
MNTMLETREPLLTKADRCDATCPAAAMVRVTTENLGVFLFCGSHFDRNKDAIPGIVRIHDERQPIPAPKEGP